MSEKCCDTAKFKSTVAKQALAGLTGLLLVLFVLFHLAGNLLIYGGAKAFNHYADMLAAMGEFVWIFRGGLLLAFVLHIWATVSLRHGNLGARRQSYAVTAYAADKTAASKYMLYTGIILLIFILFHIWDFTLPGKTGPRAIVDGEDLGLYGIVWNAFSDPFHSLFYVVGVAAVGLHLTHSVSSLWVSLGVLPARMTYYVERISRAVGVLVFLGFASIPVYIFIRNLMGGPA